MLLTGKLPAALLQELLEAGAPLPPEVRLGPAVGEDACAIEVQGGILVAATDPITLAGSGAGPHSVVINANDVAVMGVRPRWYLATVLLPEGTQADEVRELFSATSETLRKLGIACVGGHTEITPAVTKPIVVGQMLGIREDGKFVTSGGMRAGDTVVQIGPTPVEGAAVLANARPERLASLDPRIVDSARRALEDPGISVVEPALLAAELGASALHDPTEGGLSNGLYELAQASGLKLRIDMGAVYWFEPGREVCAALGADPWGTLASGALLAAFCEADLADVLPRFEARGFPARVIGRAEPGTGVHGPDGPLARFERDEVARVLA